MSWPDWRCDNWYITLTVLLILSLVGLCSAAPAAPTTVTVTSISTDSVTVNVTLSNDTYDGIMLELYTGGGGSAESSGSSPVSNFTLESTESRSFTVNSLTQSLTPGVQYTVKVQTRSGNETSGLIDASGPATIAPSAPTLDSVTESDGKIVVTWTPGAGRVDQFVVTLNPTIPGATLTKPVPTPDSPPTSMSLTVSGGVKGQRYTVTVKAESNGEESDDSGSSPVTLAPSVPTLDSATESNGEIVVTWTPGGGRADKFVVTLNPTIQGATVTKPVPTPDSPPTSMSLTISGGVKGQRYTVTVKAESNGEESGDSGSSPVTLAPSVPTLDSATESDGEIVVTWTPGAGRADKFVVTLNPTIQGATVTKPVPTPDSPPTSMSLTISGGVKGQRYTVTVKAESNGEESGDSGSSPVTLAPSVPTLDSATESDGEIVVTWTPGAGRADKFVVTLNPTIQGATVTKPVPTPDSPPTSMSLTISGGVKGQRYTVTMKAESNGEESGDSGSSPVTLAPSVPTLDSATESGGEIVVTWTPGAGRADKFVVTLNPTIQGATVTKPVPTPDSPPTSMSLTISGGVKGQRYTVTVKAESNGEESGDSGSSPVTLAPSVPTLDSATESDGEIVVTWTPGAGRADKFVITLNPTIPGATVTKPVPTPDSPPTSMSLTISGGVKGQRYTVTVKAESNGEESGDSGSSPVTLAPSVPTLDSATESDGEIVVTWTPGAGRADKFVVTLNPTIQGATVTKPVPTPDSPPTSMSLTISGGVKGQRYTVTVKAESNGEESGDSGSSPVTLAPSVPTLDSATESDGEIVVTWTPGAGRADKFVVTLNPTIQGATVTKPVPTPDSPPTSMSLTISGGVKGQRYTVTVKAESNGEESGDSGSSPVTLAPSVPTLDSATESDGEIVVTWTPGAGRADKFVVTLNPTIQGATVTKPVPTPDSPPTSMSLTISGGVKGQRYTVTVKAESNGEESGDSGSSPVTLAPSVPTLTSVTESNVKIEVTWTPGGGRVDQFVVTLNPTIPGATVTKPVPNPDSPPDSMSLTISGGVKGQRYTVKVRSQSNGAQSGDSGSLPVTLDPAVPSGVGIQMIEVGNVTVQVTLSAGKFDGIRVLLYRERTLVSNGSTSFVQDTVQDGIVRSYTVAGLSSQLTPGEQYTVTVQTKSGTEYSGMSGHSPPARISPSVPSFTSAEPSSADQKIEVKFRKGAGIVSSFYVRLSAVNQVWSTEVNILYITNQDTYSHIFQPETGAYTVEIKSQSSNVNSSYTVPHNVELSAPPVNISVKSQTSRSLELRWERNDFNVKNFRLVVRTNNACFSEVHFTEVGEPTQNMSSCGASLTTNETFFSNMTLLTYNVTGLMPWTQYNIEMYLKTTGVAENPEPATLNTRTGAERPSSLSFIEAEPGGPQNITLCWSQPDPYPGPTNYTLILTDLGEGPEKPKQTVIQDFNITCSSFTNLSEFWLYKATVMASTDAGDGPTSSSRNITTLPSVPGRVVMLKAAQIDGTYRKLLVSWKAPNLRDRNANITHFNFTYKEVISGNGESFPVLWSRSDDSYSKQVPAVPQKTYNFMVVPESDQYSGEGSVFTYEAKAGPPVKPTAPVIRGCSSSAVCTSESETSFVVRFGTGFFNDITNGKIEDYGLIVKAVSGNNQEESNSLNRTTAYFKNFKTWKNSKAEFFRSPYRATPFEWKFGTVESSRSKRQTGDVVSFTVGQNSNCTEVAEGYCNGPLLSGMDYSVKAFSCTAGGCTETKYVGGFRTKKEEKTQTTVIAACVSAGVLILILIIVIILFIRHRRQKMPSSDAESDIDTSPNNIKLVVHPEADLQTSKKIRISRIFNVVDEMHKDSNMSYSSEYTWLKELSPKKPITAASLEANRNKNRYTDILPFDETRVKLLPTEDDEASDYINANYIPGYHSEREYIAAQGPLRTTVDDFWRMIWEQEVLIIVMLTKIKEKGQNKCEQYWPSESDEPHQYGDVVVELKSYSNLKTYDLREFNVSLGSTERKVKQFHYLMWPDFGVSTCEEMVDFLNAVRSHLRPNMRGPILVHCSAGVGRTGSFIAVDRISEHVADPSAGADPEIDIYGIVLAMRQNRPRMVQTEPQYIFIHDCVCEVMKQRARRLQNDQHIYGNMGFDNGESLYENTDFKGDSSIYQNVERVPRTEL